MTNSLRDILLDHNGIIKYVDFGAAKVIAKQGKTRVSTAVHSKYSSMTGTPMYMSPEVITGTTAGRRGSIDIWSLGCVILEMATGRRPWANLDNEWAIMWNIASGHSPQLPTPDQLSPPGIDFLTKCFVLDPKQRPSAAELLQHEWVSPVTAPIIAFFFSSFSSSVLFLFFVRRGGEGGYGFFFFLPLDH